MESYQITLFEETELDEVRSDLTKVKKELGNVRRGLFSRHEDLSNRQEEAKEKIQLLKMEIQELKDYILAVNQQIQDALFPDLEVPTGISRSTATLRETGMCPSRAKLNRSHFR